MIPDLDIHPGAQLYLENIVAGAEQKKILLISGKVGRGKTRALKIMHRWAAENDSKPGVKFLFPAWIHADRRGSEGESLRYLFAAETYIDERGDAARAIMRRLVTAGILFFDDLGGEIATDGKPPPPTFITGLCSLIEQRVEAGLHTVITTNFGEEEIRKFYGDRACSRIVGFAQAIEITGPDRRFAA